MASLVPGYEYDIFVSYRQKDNKHDGWVIGSYTNVIDNIMVATLPKIPISRI